MSDLLDVRENGRFAKGHKGGPGRKPRATELAYLNAMKNVCSIDDWGKITERAVKDAKQGNSKAREWLSKYLIGNPEAVVNAVQVNNYQPTDRELADNLYHTLAGVLAPVAQSLSNEQREELSRRLFSLTNLLAPPSVGGYSVDEHGVVLFEEYAQSNQP